MRTNGFRRTAGIVALFCTAAGLALAGCSTEPAATSAPTTAPTSVTAPTSTSPAPAPQVVPAAPPAAAAPVKAAVPAKPVAKADRLGPNGFGKLTFGITEKQALAAKLVVANKHGHHLVAYPVPANEAPVCITPELGVAAIFAVGDMRTPEGIGLGSTQKQVETAFPDLTREVNDQRASVAGNPKAYYTIMVVNGKVKQLGIALRNQTCFG